MLTIMMLMLVTGTVPTVLLWFVRLLVYGYGLST